MINGESVLAVIPARGGSKRVPRKNLLPFRGRTLIGWTICAGIDSRYIDQMVVSTEDAEIADFGWRHGIPFIRRPEELATDTATSEDVLRHALHETRSDSEPHKTYDWVVLLQPTSPLRIAEDIDQCIRAAQIGGQCISFSMGTMRRNGAVYVARSSWIAEHDFSHPVAMHYFMPEERSLDINTEEDFSL